MRWRPVAATAAGVVAVLGLGAGKAAAEDAAPESPTTTTTVAPEPTGREDDLARANELLAIRNQMPPEEPKPAPPVAPVEPVVPVEQPTAITPVGTGVAPTPTPPERLLTYSEPPSDGITSKVGETRTAPAASAPSAAAPEPAAPAAPEPEPVAPTPPPAPPATAAAATSTSTTVKSGDAAVAPTVASVSGTEQWWPTWVGEIVDQRLAAAWRETPVRGPPPGIATALGNDSQTTVTQVAIVKDADGTEVAISTGQTANVNNVGTAQAEAHGSGGARATGDRAATTIYQTSVVVQRGSGTATVEQDANVDNLGYGLAASTGAGDAEAVGNASDTTIHQTAVVVIEGAGDGTVSQSAAVRNAGSAQAVSTTRATTATGNASSTSVNQVAVVVVHDEDKTVTQTSTTDNIGLATATDGTASGNVATNTIQQVAATK